MAAARNVCLCAAWFKCEEEVNLASRIKGARGMNPTESGWCPLVSGAGSSWCLFLCPFHLSGDVVNQYNPQRQHFTEIFPRKSFFSTRPQWLRTCPPHRFLSVNSLFFFRHLLPGHSRRVRAVITAGISGPVENLGNVSAVRFSFVSRPLWQQRSVQPQLVNGSLLQPPRYPATCA